MYPTVHYSYMLSSAPCVSILKLCADTVHWRVRIFLFLLHFLQLGSFWRARSCAGSDTLRSVSELEALLARARKIICHTVHLVFHLVSSHPCFNPFTHLVMQQSSAIQYGI